MQQSTNAIAGRKRSVSVYLDDVEYDAVNDAAWRARTSMSKIAREAIRDTVQGAGQNAEGVRS